MNRALVVYATKSGCTAGIAEAIGDALRGAGVDVAVHSADDAPAPSGLDAVIVGSGVRAGSWHASARQWVVTHAGSLKERPVALFTACLTMHSEPEKADEVRAYTDALLAETGVEPVEIGLFPGMYLPKEFSLPERLIMKAMKAPEGDFRDYDAVKTWTLQVASKLGLVS